MSSRALSRMPPLFATLMFSCTVAVTLNAAQTFRFREPGEVRYELVAESLARTAVPAAVSLYNTVFTANDFVRPNVTASATTAPDQGALGVVQQLYAAQYSMAGGNVAVSAGRDLAHYTLDTNGNLSMDSQRQLPNNWLMRRGYVNPAGEYGAVRVSSGGRTINDAAASTTWWVDFSNFFDGIAALGGGNVDLRAGRDVQNVSAHVPTNARAARGVPSQAGLLEMGGGDLTVTAGRNIDAGIYYVERGTADLFARNEITTNATRSPSLGRLGQPSNTSIIYPEQTWLPTTFFLGRGSLDVTAGGNALAVSVVPVSSGTTAYLSFTNSSWSTATITARGAMIYNASQGNKCVAVLDFGSDKVSVAGTFTIVFPTAAAGTAIIQIA
jgi:hypothetical protein